MDYKIIDMKVFGDERGKLISVEGNRSIPFDIKRVYWIYDTLPNKVRGEHSHKSICEIVVAMSGSCKFVMDDGKTREEVLLNSPNQGLFVGKNIWIEMHDFSHGCKLMVLASDYYTEDDYIRNYDDFLKEVNK